MDAKIEIPNKELKPLSASRVKTFENCSWLYYAENILKIPQSYNEGSAKGSAAHWTLEILIKDKYRDRVKSIISNNTISKDKSLVRLVKLFMAKAGLPAHNNVFHHIDEMILVGLKSDFYVEGATLIGVEYKFDFINESPKFRMKGFIDKLSVRGDEIVIDDYKSSKRKYEGEDKEANMQALFYSYACKKLFPNLKPLVRFIFLQFPEDPIMEVRFYEDALLGFAYFLESIQEKFEGFNENVARCHLAANDPAGTDTFSGRLLCGYNKNKTHMKKDGSGPIWGCPAKFSCTYYTVRDKDGHIIESSFKKETLKSKGEITEEFYPGCVAFRNHIDSIPSVPVKTYPNAFDDFL